MKKVIAFVLLISVIFTLCACGSAPAQNASPAPEVESAEPGMTDPTEDSSEFESIYNEAAQLFYIDHEYVAAFSMIKDMEDCGHAPILRLLGYCWYYYKGVTPEDIKSTELYADLGGSLGRDINLCHVKGMELIEKAVDGGDLLAISILADIYDEGYVVCEDGEKAEALYSRFMETAEAALDSSAPEYGSMLCYIGNSYLSGYGVEEDYAIAMEWFVRGAEAGDALSMNQIGYMYYKGYGVEQDYALAMEWFMRGADAGYAGSASWIQHMYSNGYGVEQDYALAMEWNQKGIEAGVVVCMNQMGYMYYSGYGVEQDYALAMEWFVETANAGGAPAMTWVASMYYYGIGVEQDYALAMEWFMRGAEAGDEQAMNQIGYMYSNGYGVEQDYELALEWYIKGAEAGYSVSMFNAGKIYYSNFEDYANAAKYFQMAYDNGDEDAAKYLQKKEIAAALEELQNAG